MNDERKQPMHTGASPHRGGKRLAQGAPIRKKAEPPKPGRREAPAKRLSGPESPGSPTEREGTAHRRAAAVAEPETMPRRQAAKPPRKPEEIRESRVSPAVMEPEGGEPTQTQRLLAKLRRIPRRWRHIVREKQARHFPESERLPIELLLFAWGMFPMLGSRLREVTWGRRKRAIHQFAKVRTWLEGQKAHPAAFLSISVSLAAVALFFSMYTYGTTVTYDGEPVASVSSAAAAQDALENLEQVTARTLGAAYTIDETLLQYDSGLLRRQDLVDAAALEQDLSEEIWLVTSAYCLYVEGELIGATPYEGALEELLLQLKNGITDENTISCDFAENVEIKQEYVPSDKIMNLGYLAETLYSTKTAEVTYTVVKGDTWSEIANSHGLTSSELLALNPGYNINRLSIGEVLTMSASVPYLTMTVVQRERYVADVPFDIEYTDTANLYQGDYKVTSAGEYGAADMVANVTYVNGEEMDRTILSSVTLRDPVTEQRLRGTKERPSWMATGTFRWPCTGRVTSRFGYRNLSYSYASTNHKGIDIAGKRGTPIYAADGGTVTYAGWMSGYGYLVQISHGNGYVTYYGHNSSLLVSKGQHVYKGQQIAKMGSTGNSTGNHCHFEVRYNGVPKNPLNYLG